MMSLLSLVGIGRRKPPCSVPKRRPRTVLRLESLEERAVPSFLVTNLNDTENGSLRAAINNANAAGGNQEIDFQAGLNGTIQLESALPDVTANINIVGPGANTITVKRDPNATATFRIFTVDATATNATISGLSITGGIADGLRATYGGGISNQGHLSLVNDSIFSNKATGISPIPLGGGGLQRGDPGRV